MPIQVLFIQGGGEDTHDSWDNKLADSLQHHLGADYTVRFPHMPDEADPHFVPWATAIRQQFDDMHDGDLLVGHSLGGLILLHALVEQKPPFKPGGLFLLAAPFIGEGGWPGDEIGSRTDFASMLPADMPIRLYHGTADDTVPFRHVALYEKAIPGAIVTAMPDGNHQFGEDLRAIAKDIIALGTPAHR